MIAYDATADGAKNGRRSAADNHIKADNPLSYWRLGIFPTRSTSWLSIVSDTYKRLKMFVFS